MRELFFDLDGTLIDSAVGITRCAAYALERMGEAVPDESVLRSWIGPALRESFRPLLRDPERIEQAVGFYRERFEAIGWSEHTIYPGLAEVIAELDSEGRRLSVVTAKNEPYARRIVTHLPFGAVFDEVVGATWDGSRSHKPDLIQEMLDRLGVESRHAVMIGDRRMDIEGARHHGMPGIGVLWGFGSEQELREAGATAVVARPAELSAVLQA